MVLLTSICQQDLTNLDFLTFQNREMNFCYFVTCFLVICDSCLGNLYRYYYHVLKVIFDCAFTSSHCPQEGEESGAFKGEIGVWSSQGEEKDNVLFLFFPHCFVFSQYSYILPEDTCFSCNKNILTNLLFI